MFQFHLNIFPRTQGAYIVGGSVRDLVMGRSPADYDIAVAEDPETYAREMAQKTNGHVVELGKPGQKLFRLISGDRIFDICPLNGATIEADLNQRDFTLNALAYDLSSGEIIDCTGGLGDIADKTIRMVSEKVFQKDPVRLIRAYRMAAALGFEMDSRTALTIKKDAPLIRDSAGERIHAELFKIFNTPRSHYYFSLMAESGLLFEIFPEIKLLKGCLQNRYHHYDVFEHTMKAYHHLEILLSEPDFSFPSSGLGTDPSEPADETTAALLKCAILLHDIGKPLTRTVGADGTVHFYNHEHKGADMMLTLGERLKFSTREIRFTEFIIRNHIRPLYLFRGYELNRLTRKGITRFFMKCGEHTTWLLLHSIADNMGKGDENDERTQAFTEFAKQLLADFFSDFTPRKSEPPLITGRDLIQEFGLEPSPLFKKLLNLVEEERLSKKIASRQAALERVRHFLESEM